jgi:hypothetical protein
MRKVFLRHSFIMYDFAPTSVRNFPCFNSILYTDNHALTLKSNTAKYYFVENSSFLHTFLKFCTYVLKSKGKTCNAQEPSHVKQLFLNPVCKIGKTVSKL